MAVERYEKKKNAQLTKAQREIDAIFKVAAQEAAAIAGTIRKPNPDKPFSFQDYPQTRARIAKLEEWMAEEFAQSISNNVDKEWEIAEQSGQELTSDFLRSTYEDVSNAPAALQARYFRNNTEAHDAFLARTIGGMGLSERVWRLTAQCRQEMEMAIDIGLGEGQSAQEMSRSIRKYLKEPDKLFRRVRDKHGNLVLSKAALAYHPGQGVYRSSYKNALRLTVTEGNIAYRTADHLKWQQLDFVVGIKIGLSNNHTLNGVPFHDICDELAGRYPKDFKFTGWHPFCRCIATTILMTPEEFKANEDAFLDGKEPAVRSKNEVDDVPPQFKKWRKENAQKIKSAKSLPYFVRDNEQYFKRGKITKSAAKGVKESRALNDALQQVTDPAILREQARQAVLAAAKARQANRTTEEIAAIKTRWEQRAAERRKAAILENARLRHEARTPEQIKAIRHEWFERKAIRHYGNNILSYMGGIPDVDTSALAKALKGGDVKQVLAEARKLKATGKEILGLTYLDNPMQVARTFSAAEAKVVNEAVEHKIKGWGSLSLADQKKKLEFEINYVANPGIYKPGAKQHSTWQVAQNAYKKQLANVVEAIEWEDINKLVADLDSYKTKSKPYLTGLADLKQAVTAKNKAEAQSLATTLANYRAKLEKAATARRVKQYSKSADGLYVGGNPFKADELAKLKEYESKIIDDIISGRGADDNLIAQYHDYVVRLSEKYYSKQASLFTDEERNAMKAVTNRYLARPKTNPKYIWGSDVGGVYSGKVSKAKSYLPKLNGLTLEELSIVQRFTNGSTFSNCYNLRNESEYWRDKFKAKLSNLSKVEIKQQYEIIEEWSQSANYILDRMVRYNGITFRGLNSGGGPELRKSLTRAFNMNKPWVNNASCSTSMKHSVAERFDGDTILIVHNKTGAYIHPISDYSGEYEIMTLRGTKYKVLVPPKRIGSRYYVEIEEII